MGQWVRLCGVAEAPGDDGVMEVEAQGSSLCLARVNGELAVLDNWCPHRQGPLGQGWVEGNTVVCPWHAWSFDVRSGQCEIPGGAQVAVCAVRVEGDEVLVEMDGAPGASDGSASR